MSAKKTKHAKTSVKQVKSKSTPKKSAIKAHKHVKQVKIRSDSKKQAKVKLSAKALLKKVKASAAKRNANLKAKKMLTQRLDEQMKRDLHMNEVKKIGELVENKSLLSAVGSNVGGGAADILRALVEEPKTDESIAERLNIKVNDVRRMLNVMNSYSIVRYDVNKDTKGWLIFTWRIDSEKLSEYVSTVSKQTSTVETALPGNCNDFFVCKKCYSKERTVLPFDSAFESDFSCGSCGKPYSLLSRDETMALFKTVQA